jgi:hypothetical protein
VEERKIVIKTVGDHQTLPRRALHSGGCVGCGLGAHVANVP